MLGKLLTTADGKIPYLQIAIGIIIGIIGMFAYAKFYKPKILFEDSLLAAPVTNGKRRVDQQQQQQQSIHQQINEPQVEAVETTTISTPSFIDISQMGQPMPKLQTIFEQDEYSNTDMDENDELSDDALQLRNAQ